MKNVNLHKIERMGVIAFENALRLHEDSIILFRNKRVPSAYALSVLSLEEIGKYYVLEDFIWHSYQDRCTPKEEEDFLKLIYHHRAKQNMFAYQNVPSFAKKAIEDLYSGKIDKLKQDSIYVGLPRFRKSLNLKGRMSIPINRISDKKAEKHITLVNDFILTTSAGVLKGFYIVDIWEMEDILNYALITRLKELWPSMSKTAQNKFDFFMKHPDDEKD